MQAPTGLDQRNAGHRVRSALDGGVPDQELLPGYRSWSWMCCSTSPHRPVEAPNRPVECHPRSENSPSGPSTTCLVASLGRPLLRRSPQGDRDRHGGGRGGRCAFGSAGRAVPDRPYRRGVRWARDAAPAWPCPPAWWVGRSPATRPRAVRPREAPEDAPARGDHHPARIGDRQGPQLHLLAEARRPPSVHPPDLRLALPGLPHPRPAVLQPRRPAVPGARHRAAGGGAAPAVAGQGDDEGRHRPRRSGP
jgi:hypothetical protein